MIVTAASRAHATAGFAETSREFVYGAFILRWHHGDICPDAEGKSCFYFSDPSGVPPLAEVSVPVEPDATTLLGRRIGGGPWLVYDLRARETIVETADYDVALGTWRSLGNPEPTFASAADPTRRLSETRASRQANRLWLLAMWLPTLVFALAMLGSTVAAGFVGRAALRSWRSFATTRDAWALARGIGSVALALLFLLPAVLLVLLVVRVVVG